MVRTFAVDPQLRLLAAALVGDEASLQTLANSSELQPQILANRLAPALAIHSTDLGIEGPEVEVWMQHMRSNAVFRMRLEAARRALGEIFAECDIPWTPLKGMGLDPRIYERPEARISTDLDVLVSPGHSLPARDHLVSLGWRSTETTDRSRRYVADEGYNWHLGSPDGLALELHFRLWGGVSEEFAAGILGRAQPAPEFGATARRIDLADSYLIAAVHVWQTPPPRYLALWWDLHRMADTMHDHEIHDAIARADRHGLHAFVSASAGTAADLWNNPNNQLITDELARGLHPAERWADSALRRSSPATASLGTLTLGRLFANRPSRSGWRAVPRQIWAHPGTVEANTPDTWPWPRRRMTDVARKLHLTKK